MKSSARLGHVNSKKAVQDFAVASAAGWQMKDLLTNVDTRNALLNSPYLETAFSALSIISHATIERCAEYEVLDTSPLVAYSTFAIYMSLQNVDSSLEQTKFDHTLDHLLSCAEKLFSGAFSERPGYGRYGPLNSKVTPMCTPDPTEGAELKSDIVGFRRARNAMKVATSVLMFIVDSATMGLAMQNHIRCLQFGSAYTCYIISFIKTHQHDKSSLKDENLKETTAYLRSSFTYASKLLHLVLNSSTESSPPPTEVSTLVNDLLDLVASIETHLGSTYTSPIASVAKAWLPILILGLGSKQLIKDTWESGRSDGDEPTGPSVPLWLALLGKVELRELDEISQDEIEASPSVFKKLVELMVLLLRKGDPRILDAVGGGVFLRSAEAGMETEDFGLVLGLVHFLCVKLIGKDFSGWKDLELVPSSLREMHLLIEGGIKGNGISEEGRHKLESAVALLSSFCTSSV